MKKTPFILLSLLIFLNTAFAEIRGIRKVEFKTPSGETVGLYEESHALVIGVSDYTAGWPDLESVAKDVDLVSASLEGHGFNVVRVLNPTKRELSAAFGDFIDEYGYDPENRLLFYYSGHGYTQELHGRQVGYLVPSDAPDPNEDQIGFFRRSLRMTQILSWSKQIQAKHALFLFDSCFSGSVLKERALVVPQQIQAVTDKPVRQFISAGSAGQTVPAVSIFRPSFIRGIQGEADLDKDGYVTGTELGLFLQKRVTSYDTGQTPQFGKIKDPLYDEGDFVFALEKSLQKKDSTITAGTPATSQFLPDEEMWKEVKDSEISEDFEDFLAAFPNSKLAPVAMLKLKRLKRKQTETKKELPALVEEKDRVVIYFRDEDGKENWYRSGDENKHPKYVGEIKNGEPHGHGTYIEPGGYKYIGEFINGFPNGQGAETYPDGTLRIGNFKDADLDGQGKWLSPDKKSFFIGEWKDGKRKGQGIYSTPYFIYVGEWQNNRPNGQGTDISSNGEIYVGEFKDFKKNGYGNHFFFKGEKKTEYYKKYFGEFKNDKKDGQGIESWNNGKKLIGEWKDGSIWIGTEYNKDGTIEGEYLSGKWEKNINLHQIANKVLFSTKVNGKTIWNEKRRNDLDGKYVGEVENKVPNGNGVFILPNGSNYIGEFKDGKPNGQGEETHYDGYQFAGGWKDGEKNGLTTVITPLYSIIVVEFKNDSLFDGQATLIEDDGRKFIGKNKGLGYYQGTFVGSEGIIRVGEFGIDNIPWNINEYDKNGNLIATFVNGVKN